MGATTLVQHKIEVSDYKPTSKPSSKKARIVRVDEVDFCTAFIGGIPGNRSIA